MTARRIGYWATTLLIALETLVGGVTDLTRGRTMLVAGPPVVDIVTGLGYPAYVLKILGTWKLLGALAVLAPRSPQLKEWAYAGLVFHLTGAAASQAARRRSLGEIVAPLVLAGLALASWALRPPRRAARSGARPHTAGAWVQVGTFHATVVRAGALSAARAQPVHALAASSDVRADG